MPTQKPHRIRVRTTDGQPREPNQLKGKFFPHLDVIDAGGKVEFILCAIVERHLIDVRAKLPAAGLEEMPTGAIDLPALEEARGTSPARASGREPVRRSSAQTRSSQQGQQPDFRKKPYGFVPVPATFVAGEPVWHDGSGSSERVSGEVRLELTTLTPLLVGWERRKVVDEPDTDDSWKIPFGWVDRENNIVDVLMEDRCRTIASKAVLCPLRAPWGARPVIIPGDSLKGLLRHELGALRGAPMERVAERSYSYRPNSLFPNNPRLVARIARVPQGAVEKRPFCANSLTMTRVPTRLELLPLGLRYDRQGKGKPPWYRFDPVGGGPDYRGGQGAGERLNSKRALHRHLGVNPATPLTSVDVPPEVIDGYLHTLRHLVDTEHGHFSERHPDLPNTITGDQARTRILTAAENVVFRPGDLIWVEWDTTNQCVVSFGWHYYYRWAYEDTVRWRGRGTVKRAELFPSDAELQKLKDGSPERLTAVRRLFGYTGDNDGSAGIGADSHSQLMGRLSVNAAIEVVPDGCAETDRFLPPTFLRELGMPRPSAVEHYLEQPYWPNSRPSDRAKLVTYGDAAGYDKAGELAGRKFYLDRRDAYTGEPWADDSESNRLNDRSTLALEASRPCRRFRFTVRFRDLDSSELVAILLALCPDQFGETVGGNHTEGYCSKLGYARPLGWGTVRIEAKGLYFLSDTGDDEPALSNVEIDSWFCDQLENLHAPLLEKWLAVHRHKHPDAADYPRENGEIFAFHTKLRADHSRARRYRKG